MVGINTKNQTIIKIATAVVDHGMEAATRTGYMSTQKSQNEDRVADKKRERTFARAVAWIRAQLPACLYNYG